MKLNPVIISAILLPALMVSGASKSRADEPIITSIAIGLGTSIVGAWIYDKISGDDDDDEPQLPSCWDTCLKWGEDEENCGAGELCTFSINIPDDVRPTHEFPDGLDMAETVSFESAEDGKRVELRYENVNYHANVTEEEVKSLSFRTTRRSQFRFIRPVSDSSEETSTLEFDIYIEGLKLSTTDVPETVGGAGYEIIVSSPQLGVIFATSAYAPQGQEALINGDLSSDVYVSEPGFVELGNFSDSVSIKIPPSIFELNMTVEFSTFGTGVAR